MEVNCLLVIEDNEGDVRLIKELFAENHEQKFELDSASTLEEGFKKLHSNKYAALLLDLNLPDSKGIETFNKINSVFKNLPIVILTALNDQEAAIHAVSSGAQDYIDKNELASKSLCRCVLYAILRHRCALLQLENLSLIINHLENITTNLDGLVKCQREVPLP